MIFILMVALLDNQKIGKFSDSPALNNNNQYDNNNNGASNIISSSSNNGKDGDDSYQFGDLNMVDHPTVHVRLSGQDCIRGTFNQR